jgi:hypothetical protein
MDGDVHHREGAHAFEGEELVLGERQVVGHLVAGDHERTLS